jgi:hypothetical protein
MDGCTWAASIACPGQRRLRSCRMRCPGPAGTVKIVGVGLAGAAGRPRPVPPSFMADDDAAANNSTTMRIPKGKREIQPHGMADDLGREPVPAVAGCKRMASSLPTNHPGMSAQLRKNRPVRGANTLDAKHQRHIRDPLRNKPGWCLSCAGLNYCGSRKGGPPGKSGPRVRQPFCSR